MKRQIIDIPIDLVPGIEIALAIRKPGIIRQLFVDVKHIETKPSIWTKSHPQINFRVMATLLVEIDPNEKDVTRYFCLVPPGKSLEAEGELEYKGTFFLPDDDMLHLFEELGNG